MNAANEVAVDAFLGGRIPWTAIAEVVAATIDRYDPPTPSGGTSGPEGGSGRDIDDVLEADAAARRVATGVVSARETAA